MKLPKIIISRLTFLSIFIITILFFVIPFFWLKSGFVDLGGDGSRWYFIDPLFYIQNLINQENITGEQVQSLIPFGFVLYILKLAVTSSTNLININNGISLSFGFLYTCLTIRELLSKSDNIKNDYKNLAGIIGGIAYISFISNQGWSQALHTHSQIFVNPLMFYLLLRFFLTSSIKYGYLILLVTVLASQNFGFSAMPQLMSFFPLSLIFIFIYIIFFRKLTPPWKNLLIISLLFIGLHAFHIIPTFGVLTGKTGLQDIVFNKSVVQSYGVNYFDVNHIELGKISKQLFAPSEWGSQNIVSILIPLILVLGFLKNPSKILMITSIFYLITLFLVSANITDIGVKLYRSLYYIPGFAMFRSFNDRWYFVYSFFYALLFAFSYFELIRKIKISWIFIITLLIILVILIRINPFLQGKAIYAPLNQTDNVTSVMKIDPDLISALEFTKNLPQDGKVLTLPLTFPYYQIAYGIEGGAYRGTSLVFLGAGKTDYAGFWAFGKQDQKVFGELYYENFTEFRKTLDDLEVKYIFRNKDTRIMDNFPGYPYVYPGMIYSSKDQLPIIKTQTGYNELLSKLPLKKIFEKGFYSIYELSDSPKYPQNFIDSDFHIYFYIGRIVSVFTFIGLIGFLSFRKFLKYA